MNLPITSTVRQFVFSVVLLGALLLISSLASAAWAPPSATAPTCPSGSAGCDAPINEGASTQYKKGALGVASATVYGDTAVSGSNLYLNFGSTVGVSGYGIRDNAGTMEHKDSGGTWTSFVRSPTVGSSYVNSSGYGIMLGCNNTDFVTAVCTVGRDADCQGYYTRVTCTTLTF